MFERFFRRRAKPPAAVFGGLRDQALAMTPEALGIAPTAELPHVFGAIMESCLGGAVVTLVVLADAVSLYLSTGGGIIGAGQRPAVRQAADAFLRSAESVHSQLERAEDTPPPEPGRVRFYVRTFDGTLAAEAEQRVLVERRHALSGLFYAAHQVIARIRQTAATNAPGPNLDTGPPRST